MKKCYHINLYERFSRICRLQVSMHAADKTGRSLSTQISAQQLCIGQQEAARLLGISCKPRDKTLASGPGDNSTKILFNFLNGMLQHTVTDVYKKFMTTFLNLLVVDPSVVFHFIFLFLSSPNLKVKFSVTFPVCLVCTHFHFLLYRSEYFVSTGTSSHFHSFFLRFFVFRK